MTGNAQQNSVPQLMDDLAAWMSGDGGRVASLFTEDVVYEDVGLGIVCRGKDEFRAFAERFFAARRSAPRSVRCVSIVADGTNHVAAEFTEGRLRYVSVMELEGGGIKRNTDYYDLATGARLGGLLLDPWLSPRGQAFLKALRGE